jgi:hypothetical protein
MLAGRRNTTGSVRYRLVWTGVYVIVAVTSAVAFNWLLASRWLPMSAVLALVLVQIAKYFYERWSQRAPGR